VRESDERCDVYMSLHVGDEVTLAVGGQVYEKVLENGQLVGLRRFNKEYKRWIVMKFSDDVHAETELLRLLKTEYIQQQVSDTL